MNPRLIASLLLVVTSACDPCEQPPVVEGVDAPLGPCGHALYVIASDYASTTVSIVDWSGANLGPSMLTSGSTPTGLSVALSGDVVAPTDRMSDGRVRLVDRYPAGVVTVLDPKTADVLEQLIARTGFAANPQDLLSPRPGTLYVSRYEQNPTPGREPYDAGSDILLIDEASGEPAGSIDLRPLVAASGLLPRPSRLVRAADGVVVLLSTYSQDFGQSGSGQLGLIDPASDELLGSLELPGLVGCSGLAVSPSGKRLAVGCSGSFGGDSAPDLSRAGLAFVALDMGFSVERVVSATELGNAPPSFSLSFANEETVLLTTFGELGLQGGVVADDQLLSVRVDGQAALLLRSANEPFSLGEVRCSKTCGTCIVTDASRMALQIVEPSTSGFSLREVAFDDGVGLPPRYLGAY